MKTASPSRRKSPSIRKVTSPRRRYKKSTYMFPFATIRTAIKDIIKSSPMINIDQVSREAVEAVSIAVEAYAINRAERAKSLMNTMTPKLKTLMDAPVRNAFQMCGGPLGMLDPITFEDGPYLQPAIVKRLINSVGIAIISGNAKDMFNDYLNAFINRLVTVAATYAQHSRRKTLQKRDIMEALRQLEFKVYM